MARSMPRAIFSPTTTPMLPPMNPYSIDATTVSMPSMAPDATMTASFMPVLSMPALSRDLYGLVSVNTSGSVETMSLSNSVHSPSNSIRSRSEAFSRKWWPHFGQTLKLVARSLL